MHSSADLLHLGTLVPFMILVGLFYTCFDFVLFLKYVTGSGKRYICISVVLKPVIFFIH